MPTPTEPVSRAGPTTAASPGPARVPGNLWTAIEVPDLGALDARATVSVVVSGKDPDGHLPLTLASLAGQTYPGSLTQVVVKTESPIGADELRAAAGGRALELQSPGGSAPEADGEVLILLPAGSLAERELVEAHARWHHAVADAVTAGSVRRIDASRLEPSEVLDAQRSGGLEELLSSRLAEHDEDHASLETFLERTHGLTERRPDTFRVAARGSVSLRSDTLRSAGGPASMDDFTLARLDLAYRLDCAGCVFVPERAARGYGTYPEPWIGPFHGDGSMGDGSGRAAAGPDPRVASLIPVPGFRPRGAGRLFTRPAMVVDVEVEDEPAAEVLGTVDAVLRGRLSDLAVRILLPEEHPERRRMEAACAADPRVEVASAPGELRTDAPYQVTMPVSAHPGDDTLEAIHELMSAEALGALRVTVPSRADRLPLPGGRIADRVLGRGTLAARASGPLARARRIAAHQGEPADAVLARLFEERRLPGAEIGLRRGAAGADDGGLGPASDLAHERAEHLRFRARAATSQARADRQTQRLHRERLRSVHERTSADRLEARLARVNPAFWVVWKAKRVARRIAAVPRRLVARIEALRQPLYRLRQAAMARIGRRGT